MKNAPIALFAYNRPEHTQKTVEALRKNLRAKDSELYIFSDGPKNDLDKVKVEEVRKYLKTIDGFKKIEIVEMQKNLGLANSIISGVTKIVNRFEKIIVLEDDLVTSPYFLKYMNDALNLYRDEDSVISIHGYCYPVKNLPETFFIKGTDCWGWATWKRGWDLFEPNGKKLLIELEEKNLIKKFDLDSSYHFSSMLKKQIAGENNSWAIRWHASAFLKDKLTLYPGISLVQNIGQDATGTHKGKTDYYKTTITSNPIVIKKIPIAENTEARLAIIKYHTSGKPTIIQKILRKILKIKYGK
ncbi:MAG: glycosyltransferase family 2 protein [Parcubacteria group bacterium]|nr:glycosyltransferase family 2 protein [Parcubacteria group bacterium]